MEEKKRRLIIRLGIVVAWFALGALIFVTSRGHTLLIDNKNIADLNLRAQDEITVTVDKNEPEIYYRNDRLQAKVGGGKHRITIEFSDGTPEFKKEFRLPLKADTYLLSLPKMIAGVEPFYEPFTGNAAPPPEENANLPDEVPTGI
jgi:hypothetical protein